MIARLACRICGMKKAAAPKVSFAGALVHSPSDKRVDILRLIGQSGSISQAARDAGVSYKAAWQAIDTLTNLAGVALVERAVGGAGGGGASLTAAGTELLVAAGQLEQARRQVLARLQSDAPGIAGGGVMPKLGQLSVRTSMRNQLPCSVQSLQASANIVHVTLAFSHGGTVVSRITTESAELLGLVAGLPVVALCKATAVGVLKAASAGAAPLAGRNQLAGRALRVSRGASGDEVTLTLDGGLQMVGFAPPGSGIRVGARVVALVDDAAVVVALAG